MSQNDIRAGGAYVELLLKQQRFQTGLKRAGATLKSFARSAILLGGPLVAAFSFKEMISSASDLEETMNKFNVVFGKNAAAVKQWSDGFAKEVGRSEEQIARFVSNSQDLFIPLGFAPGAAEEMSKQITGLSIDLASFNNMADDDTMRDLHAALTGSGEVMKKYGVVLSEAAVKQELLNRGMDPSRATDQEKVQARLNIIMRGTTAAQGDAIRSAGGFANQVKALMGRLSDTAATIGSLFMPAVTSIVGVGIQVLDSIRNMAQGIIHWVSQTGYIWAAAWQAIVDTTMPVLQLIYQGIEAYVNLWKQVIVGGLKAISFAFSNWRVVLETAATSAMLSIVRFGNQTVHLFSEVIPTWLSWFGENWYDVFTDIASLTATVATNIWDNLVNLWDAIAGLFSGEGFNFEWTPLTEGFESAIKELPKIAEREMGPLEASLQRDLDKLATEMVNNWEDHGEKFADTIANFLPAKVEFDAVAAAQEAGIGEVGQASQQRGNVKKDVVSSFSLSQLAAQVGTGDTTTDELRGLRRDQARQHRELITAVNNGGTLNP